MTLAAGSVPLCLAQAGSLGADGVRVACEQDGSGAAGADLAGIGSLATVASRPHTARLHSRQGAPVPALRKAPRANAAATLMQRSSARPQRRAAGPCRQDAPPRSRKTHHGGARSVPQSARRAITHSPRHCRSRWGDCPLTYPGATLARRVGRGALPSMSSLRDQGRAGERAAGGTRRKGQRGMRDRLQVRRLGSRASGPHDWAAGERPRPQPAERKSSARLVPAGVLGQISSCLITEIIRHFLCKSNHHSPRAAAARFGLRAEGLTKCRRKAQAGRPPSGPVAGTKR